MIFFRSCQAAVIGLATWLCLVGPALADFEPTVPPFGVCLIPEMDYLPEVEGWIPCAGSGKEYAEDLQRATAAWKDASEWAEKNIAASTVNALSKWAKTEMQNYAHVPPFGKAVWRPATVNEGQRKLVFQSTVEILPTHSGIVERRLEIFMLWDRERNSMIRLTVTIRGSRLE